MEIYFTFLEIKLIDKFLLNFRACWESDSPTMDEYSMKWIVVKILNSIKRHSVLKTSSEVVKSITVHIVECLYVWKKIFIYRRVFLIRQILKYLQFIIYNLGYQVKDKYM